MSFTKFLKRCLIPLACVGIGSTASAGFLLYTGDEDFYSKIVMPTVQSHLDGEQAHRLAIMLAKYELVPRKNALEDERMLCLNVFGRSFSSPLGLAAGFDKHGEAIEGLLNLGFGFVEIGTVTPFPQDGNPKPRVFRLPEDRAAINRYGFNSEGHDAVLERIKKFRFETKRPNSIVGINIGKNKVSTEPLVDYMVGLNKFGNYADYLVINISSPNTPGLRSLQNKAELEKLIDPILEQRNKLNQSLPVLVKIAPDLTDDELKDIAQVLSRKNKSVDGVIISNTTIERPSSLKSESKSEQGGLSGRPLKEKSTEVLAKMSRLLSKTNLVLIGVGGIENARDALNKIKAGASLVQLYTAMTFEGPTLVERINRDLIQLLKEEGFSNVSEAIGANYKTKK